jgi:hypothetical protein
MPSLMAACASFGSFLNAFGKRVRGAVGKLLAHLRHAAVVQPHRIGVKSAPLRAVAVAHAANPKPNRRPKAPINRINLFPNWPQPSRPIPHKLSMATLSVYATAQSHRLRIGLLIQRTSLSRQPIYTSTVICLHRSPSQ